MIKKTEKVVISFHTTTDAMAMEQICKEKEVEGRLIPVPSSITAGCGLAWCGPPEKEEEYVELMREHSVIWQGICVCMV